MSIMKTYRILFATITIFFFLSWFSACGKPGKSVYTIARDPSWYPLALLSKEKNVLAFSDEVILKIAKDEGFKVSTLFTNSNSIEVGLDNGTFDAVMTTLQPTAFRRDKYEFSDPYFFAGPVLVVPLGSPCRAFDQAGGLRIGVRRTALEVYNVQVTNDVDFRLFDNILTALYGMLRGELDGVIMDLVPAYSFAQGVFRDRIEIVGEPLTMAGIRLVASRENAPGLVTRFNRGLKKLRDTEAYQQMLQKWGLYNPEILHELARSQGEVNELVY
jgi:polar amino acid transport system substrate-binding protein